MNAAQRIDLANRRNDGIDVTLWWSPADDSVAVEVLRRASDSSFELAVDRASALDAFYHPFAYAARRSPELLDVAASRALSLTGIGAARAPCRRHTRAPLGRRLPTPQAPSASTRPPLTFPRSTLLD